MNTLAYDSNEGVPFMPCTMNREGMLEPVLVAAPPAQLDLDLDLEKTKGGKRVSMSNIESLSHDLGPNLYKMWSQYKDEKILPVMPAISYARPNEMLMLAANPVNTIFKDRESITMWQLDYDDSLVLDDGPYTPSRLMIVKLLTDHSSTPHRMMGNEVTTVISAQQWEVATAMVRTLRTPHSMGLVFDIITKVTNALEADIEIAEKATKVPRDTKFSSAASMNLGVVNRDITSRWIV